MAGGVYEWVRDEYKSYDSSKTDDSPVCSTPTYRYNNKGRVLRGGSWSGDAGYLRAADRNDNSPSIRRSILGFRLQL